MTFELKAQTHFSQGWNISLLDAVHHFELDGIRDSLPWSQVETAKGVYNFGSPKTAWMDNALAQGIDVTLVFAHANALYDGGKSVHTDAGRAAFANYVVATLQRYPNVTSIEIGNEYNSKSFVTGPVASASMSERAVYYAQLIKAVGSALDAAGIDVEVLGGATHSIPVDYFAILKDEGALDYIDAVSIHPYTTPPEQFEEQVAVLRGVIGNDMPITVTEFGQHFESLDDAPAYLAKMVSVMGAAGIESASWYALAKQKWFPNMELWNPAGGETPAGTALNAIENLLDAGGAINRVAVDDFTYLYSFGDHAALLWGADGQVRLGQGMSAFDLFGNPIEHFDGKLSHDAPIILRSTGTINSASIAVDHDGLVGDSFDQFDVTNEAGGTTGFEGPWSYYAESDAGKIVALYTMGGGLKGGEPWTPYLGTNSLRPLQVSASSVTPVDFASGNPKSKYAVVERYTVAKDGIYDLKGHFDVDDATTDGVILKVRVNGSEILARDIYDIASGHVFDLDVQNLTLAAGDHIDFVIGSRSSPKGDTTDRHIQIFEDIAAEKLAAALPGPDRAIIVPRASVDFSDRTYGVQLNLKTLIATIGNERTKLAENPDVVIGSAQDDRLNGDDRGNELHGGAGDDKLFGKGGDDFLHGGAGSDRLQGGEGADIFHFEGFDGPREFDTILDFTLGEDRISLNGDMFAELRAGYDGALVSGQFAYDKALTADHHIIYNTRNGALYYDADGSGAQQAVMIAKLSHVPMLDASDIIVM